MPNDKEEIVAYHGTTKAAKDEIISSGKFKKSQGDKEWAGTGIYFFIDSNCNQAINNAKSWSHYIKINEWKNVAVIEAHILINPSLVLDLRIDQAADLFHRYRNLLFEKAVQKAQANGRNYLGDQYSDVRKFDCLTFNHVCSKFGIKAVIKKEYINFYHHKYDGYSYKSSSVPNCTIMCLRDDSLITELK